MIGLALITSSRVSGNPIVAPQNATDFFTNTAQLLFAKLNLREANQQLISVTNIPIFPATNHHYTPSVHRILQLTANLYDSTTNRIDFPGQTNAFLPSVFRPLFRRDASGSRIWIAGYREIQDASMVQNAPRMVDLNESGDSVNSRDFIPLEDEPFDPVEANEPMVFGIPLVIGAKKGLPNFNELAMDTTIEVTRLLQFKRPGTSTTLPPATNQMYLLNISNSCGIEAWNSYSNTYPRALQAIAVIDAAIALTNENNQVIFSNRFYSSNVVEIPAGTWTGFLNPVPIVQPSLLVPLSETRSLIFGAWNNLNQEPWFLSPTSPFQLQSVVGFPAPQWWMNLRVRARFVLVDTSTEPHRLVDYVNLEGQNTTLDITGKLREGAFCSSQPTANIGDQWCTNRIFNSGLTSAPTLGILNQINVCLSNVSVTLPDWQHFQLDPATGADRGKAIDVFRVNLNFSHIFYSNSTYYKSNVFYAPFRPFRTIHFRTRWQVNDPLVHYLISDLGATNSPDFLAAIPPLNTLGRLNVRYEPWGGNPSSGGESLTRFESSVKDPLVMRSDDWNFPSGEPLSLASLGRIHRGTPWQTSYLKSSGIPALIGESNVWEKWTGNAIRRWTGSNYQWDAHWTLPLRDRDLVSALGSFINTNDPRRLLSINDPNPDAWLEVLNGLFVLTNTVSDADILNLHPPQFLELLMASNSPQAGWIAAAIQQTRASNSFRFIGDLLSVPELSDQSPWLNRSALQRERGIHDEAYEKIPSQLLAWLRVDSLGSFGQTNGQFFVQFSGEDGYRYVLESSTNLMDWEPRGTNVPVNGFFTAPLPLAPDAFAEFYRSVLVP